MIAAEAVLAEIVGAERVVSEASACAAFSVDGLAPSRVVYPVTGEQVARALRYAAENGLAVIPCRNRTKIGIGNTPRKYDLALCLKEMNQVWHYEPADLTISVEPGMKLADLQRFVGRDGLWVPLDPPGGGRSSVGGILATNAAGPMRLRYGAPRDFVLGTKIATTQGKIVKTGGRVVKNVAGYDLGKLVIGSYGTLGVIVEVSLKLYPLPAARASFVISAATLDAAKELRRHVLNSPLTPLRMVLLDGEAGTMVLGDSAGRDGEGLWIEVGGSARVVERCAQVLEEIGREVRAAVRPVEPPAAEDAWARISDFRGAPAAAGAMILKALLPLAASEEFAARAHQEANAPRMAAFVQGGVGVVHLCLPEPPPVDKARELVSALRAAACELGGVLVVEQAAPAIKNEIDVWGPPGDDYELMRKMKTAWDPQSALSPGRFVGGI